MASRKTVTPACTAADHALLLLESLLVAQRLIAGVTQHCVALGFYDHSFMYRNDVTYKDHMSAVTASYPPVAQLLIAGVIQHCATLGLQNKRSTHTT
jgi:hypothetical protein